MHTHTHCNTLKHTVTHSDTLTHTHTETHTQGRGCAVSKCSADYCSTLDHTDTYTYTHIHAHTYTHTHAHIHTHTHAYIHTRTINLYTGVCIRLPVYVGVEKACRQSISFKNIHTTLIH